MFQDYLKRYRKEIINGDSNNGICFDGVVNQEKYFKRDKRLMFLLKETNGNKNNGEKNEVNTDWDYMEWVRKQAKQEETLYRSVFRNIAMWSKIFDFYVRGKEPQIKEIIDENGLIMDHALYEALENIAIVNLKKSWGIQQTVWQDMKDYLEDPVRKEILIHQVEILKPSLVLCGGTFDFAYMIFGAGQHLQKKESADGTIVEFFKQGETVFAKCYHPSRPGWARKDSFDHINNIFSLLLI